VARGASRGGGRGRSGLNNR